MPADAKIRWGELEEDDGGDLDFLLPPRVVIGPDENGFKKTIEYRFDDDGNKVKVTPTTRVVKLARTRLSKAAVERRSWAKFGDAAGSGGWSVHMDAGVLDRLAGAAWTAAGASTATATSLESWADAVLCPSIQQLKRSLSSSDVDGATTVSLSAVEGIGRRRMDGDVLFPTSVTVAVDGN